MKRKIRSYILGTAFISLILFIGMSRVLAGSYDTNLLAGEFFQKAWPFFCLFF
jgi:hypothetical protein